MTNRRKLLILGLIMTSIIMMRLLFGMGTKIEKMSFSDFTAIVKQQNQKNINHKNKLQVINIEYETDGNSLYVDIAQNGIIRRYLIILPNTLSVSGVILDLSSSHPEINLDVKQVTLVHTLQQNPLRILQALILIGWLILTFSQIRSISFSSSMSQQTDITFKTSTYKFDDVIGLVNAKEELMDLINYLKNPPSINSRYNVSIPKGYLLYGPPGNGKTLLAKALAGEAGVKFISLSGSSFSNPFFGVSQENVRKTFAAARENSPCIIFVDEIDSAVQQRHQKQFTVNTDLTNEILHCLDGFDERGQVIFMGATNNLENIDRALLRPGRIDKLIKIASPSVTERKMFIAKLREKYNVCDVETDVLTQLTEGFSGADMTGLYKEASLIAVRNQKTQITYQHLYEALQKKVLGGSVNNNLVISEETRKRVAYHESGHAITAHQCGKRVPLMTTTPRGNSLGVTFSISKSAVDEVLNTKKDFLHEIMILSAGYAAEKLIFGEDNISAGAYSDIKRMSSVARVMVSGCGLGSMGPISLEQNQFIEISDDVKSKVEHEMSNIIKHCTENTYQMLSDNIDILHRLANEALNYEVITEDQFLNIISPDPQQPKQDNEDNYEA